MRDITKATAGADGALTISRASNRIYSLRTTCRSCKGNLDSVLDLGEQFLVGFVSDPFDPMLPRAPLHLVRCSACGLLQLLHTVDHDRLFRTYWYRSSVNQSMRLALDDLVADALNFVSEGTWLDIGANDGYLLSKVPDKFKRIACEPAKSFQEDLHKVADVVIGDFFSAEHDALVSGREGTCNVITSAAMFYDVDEPDEFVADIAKALAPGGVWVNQLNDSPTMLDKNAFDAICHEHLCYYDVPTLSRLYNRHGLSIISVTYNEVNGGSVRIVATKQSGIVTPISVAGFRRPTAGDCRRFSNRVAKWRSTMLDMLQGPMSLSGQTWLYGASTKGSVLLQYLDANAHFAGIADRNPAKEGLYLAGTTLSIVNEDAMRSQCPRYLMALPWAFRDEFVKRERELLDAGTTFCFPLPSIEFVS
jgi:hypothetical protein